MKLTKAQQGKRLLIRSARIDVRASIIHWPLDNADDKLPTIGGRHDRTQRLDEHHIEVRVLCARNGPCKYQNHAAQRSGTAASLSSSAAQKERTEMNKHNLNGNCTI
jgi:hypothetical protein